MIFIWVLGISGIIYSVFLVAGFPSTMDLLSGFILGAIIDLYILIKKKKLIK